MKILYALLLFMLSIFFIPFAISQENPPILVDIGLHNFGNCVAIAANDRHNAVGQCTDEKDSTKKVAWFRYKSGNTTYTLLPMVPGMPCEALRITERNQVYGTCSSTDGTKVPVAWDGDQPSIPPIVLKPAMVGTSPDKSATIKSVGQTVTVGQSFKEPNLKGESMAVYWRVNSDVAVPITGSWDGCVPTSIMESPTNYNWITLNCPDTTGNLKAKIATKKPGNSTYVITALKMPENSTRCTLGNASEYGRVLGTCNFSGGISRATYWPTPDGEPSVMKKEPDDKSVSAYINAEGIKLIVYIDNAGHEHDALWDIHQGKVIEIEPLPSTSIVSTAGIADKNTTILINTRSAEKVNQGAYLSDSLKTVGIGFYKGGNASHLQGINPEGTFGVGSAIGADGKRYAIGFSIPH